MLPALGIRYAYTVNSTYDFAIPQNFEEWDPIYHFRHSLLELDEKFVELDKTQYLYLMYVWGHSYELPTDNGWELMEQFCQLMSGREDIWYATNIEIVDAIENAARLQFTANGNYYFNPNAAFCRVEIAGKIYEIPGGSGVHFDWLNVIV